MAPPPLPPGYEKHRVVYLEAMHYPLPPLDFPCDIINHARTDKSELRERIKDATIVISTLIQIFPDDMDHAPNLQLLMIMATGMGWVDREYCARRNIAVTRCPQSNVEAVGEHFLALYFSSRRKIPELHRAVTEGDDWRSKGTLTPRWTQGPPLSCAKETLGIIGYGHLGKRFEGLAKAVGFGKIIISERKGVTEARPGRVTLEALFRTASTIVVCCPREADTISLIDEAEIQIMRKECLIINMARGGIVNELALANALKEGRLFGAATDVMDAEPGFPGSSPLIPDIGQGETPIPNLIITPHVAWNAERTLERLGQLLKGGIEGFAAGRLEEEHLLPQVAVLNGKIFA